MKNLSNIEHELDIVTKQYVDNAADTKVDKIEGKQLSTNDFSNEDKEKLNSLENYILPTASADALGGVKIGNDLTIDENGILNIDNINYTKIENKPTLNGITIEGDKVGTDYGINDTNVYYGTEEPTAENVVMWVDPSGAPVSVLTTDNTTEYTPTEDYNPATKKYVDEHGIKVLEASTENVIDFNALTESGIYLIKNGNSSTLLNGHIGADVYAFDHILMVEQVVTVETGELQIRQLLTHGNTGNWLTRYYKNSEWGAWKFSANVTKATYTATIPTTGWTNFTDGGGYVTIANGYITANDTPQINPVLTNVNATNKAILEAWNQISRIETREGYLYIYAYEEIPTVEIPIQIMCIR